MTFWCVLLNFEDDNITGYSAPLAWNYENIHHQDKAEFTREASYGEKFQSPDVTAVGVMGWLTDQQHKEFLWDFSVPLIRVPPISSCLL